MSKRNRKPTKHSLVDIALLTAGAVDPAVFRDCITAIKREMESVPSTLYVCFNGRVPETQQAYKEILDTVPGVQIKSLNQNFGFPRGANTVIRAGTSPLVLFVSDDIVLDQGTLGKLVKTMDDPQIGLCGLKLIFPEGTPSGPAGRVQHIGHAIDIRGEVTHPLIGWKPDNPKCCVSREVQSVTGATFMVRRDVFRKAGGFFEGYGRGYFEDVDLNLTIRMLPFRETVIEGNKQVLYYKIWINTEATALHYTGATFIKNKEPGNMEVNKMILRQRRGHVLMNDSFNFW